MKKVILFIIALLMIVGIILFQKVFSKSTSNATTTYEKIDINSGENVYTYKDKIYVYGRSGLKIYQSTNLIFHDSFSSENPYAVFSEDKLIIGDKNGKTLRIYGESGILYSINHTQAIISFTVNKSGYSAIISKTESSLYEILVYNGQGDNIFYLTNITYEEGVPINLALSNNNKVLAVSFLNTDGAIIESNISIYSLSADETSNTSVFGALKKSNQVAGIIKFLNNENLLILSDSKFSIVAIKEGSKEVKETVQVNFNNKVDFVSFLDSSSFILAYGEQLTRSEENKIEKDSIVIYNSSGGKTGQLNFDSSITNIFANKYGFIICKDRFFTGYSNTGSKIFEYHATQDIKSMYFFNSVNKALLVIENEIKLLNINKKTIKLLEEYNSLNGGNLDYSEDDYIDEEESDADEDNFTEDDDSASEEVLDISQDTDDTED